MANYNIAHILPNPYARKSPKNPCASDRSLLLRTYGPFDPACKPLSATAAEAGGVPMKGRPCLERGKTYNDGKPCNQDGVVATLSALPTSFQPCTWPVFHHRPLSTIDRVTIGLFVRVCRWSLHDQLQLDADIVNMNHLRLRVPPNKNDLEGPRLCCGNTSKQSKEEEI
jgi:hypothetical protein